MQPGLGLGFRDRLRAGFRVVVVRRAEVVIARDELTRLGGAHLVGVRVRVRVCVGVRVRTRVTLTLTLTSLTLTLTLPSLGVRPSSPRARCTWRSRTRPSRARYHGPTASGADTYLRGAEPCCVSVCWRCLRGGASVPGPLPVSRVMMPHSETEPQSMCAPRLAAGRPNGDLVRRRKAMAALGSGSRAGGSVGAKSC